MVDASNPWSVEGWSITGQMLYEQKFGRARAEARAHDAGTIYGAKRPTVKPAPLRDAGKDNPWSQAGWSRTAQVEYILKNGMARAEARARDAGTTINGPLPVTDGRKYAPPVVVRPGDRPIFQIGKDKDHCRKFVLPPRKPRAVAIAARMGLGLTERAALTLEAQLLANPLIGLLASATLTTTSGATEIDIVVAAELGITVAAVATLELDFSIVQSNIGIEQAVSLDFEVQVAAAAELGISVDSLVALERDLIAAATLGIEQATSLDFEIQTAAAALLGISQATSLSFEVQVAAAALLGINQATSLNFEIQATAAASIGINQTTSLSYEVQASASGLIGLNGTFTITREQDLTASASLGISEAATLTRELSLTAAPSLGVSGTVTLTTAATNSYILCGNGGGIISTAVNVSDLNSWTTRVNGFSNEGPTTVFVNSGKTIWLCGADGSLMFSSTGTGTFVSKTSGFGIERIRGFATNGTIIVMCGGTSGSTTPLIATSTDGQTWTSRNGLFPAFNYVPNSVRFINNQFVIALGGSAGGAVISSLDGITWTSKFAGFVNRCTNIIFDTNNSTYVATVVVANSSIAIFTSTNLTVWTSKFSGFTSDCNGNGFEVISGVYVLAVTVDKGAFKSTNLTTWTSTGSGIPTGTTNRLAKVGSTFVICGGGGSLASSTDGVTWTSRNSGLYPGAISIAHVAGV